jgi:hypothetical protein
MAMRVTFRLLRQPATAPPESPEPLSANQSVASEVGATPKRARSRKSHRKEGRAAAIDAFLEACRKEGYKVNRYHIRLVARRERDPNSLKYFQSNISKASKSAVRDYEIILQMPIAVFIVHLNERLKSQKKPPLEKLS